MSGRGPQPWLPYADRVSRTLGPWFPHSWRVAPLTLDAFTYRFRAPQVIEQVRPGPSVAMAEPEKLAVLGELEAHVDRRRLLHVVQAADSRVANPVWNQI